MPVPGSTDCPLEVAIVGSGPSGFYATEALLQSARNVRVSMVERLPVPYGLVRSGVAPDHSKLKAPMQVYDRIARSEFFQFFGNVCVGRDVGIADLLDTHHAVILAYGASTDRKLGIPGEGLRGVHSATEFVGWYNGHPACRDIEFDLRGDVAAIIGHGNVAIDVARILVKDVDELRRTDISAHALDVLSESTIREVHVFGRRGPVQSKFTSRELEELGNITGVAAHADPGDLILGAACRAELDAKKNLNYAKNVDILRKFSENAVTGSRKQLHFHFFRSPASFRGDSRIEVASFHKTCLSGAPFQQSACNSGETMEFPCRILFRSVGYRGAHLEGLPFDDWLGTLPHSEGRLVRPNGTPEYGLYATGWIKRGASGVIGTNRADSVETVNTLLSDLGQLPQRMKQGARGLKMQLAAKHARVVSFDHWDQIDSLEKARGRIAGKPREKFTRVQEMLDACGLDLPDPAGRGGGLLERDDGVKI